MFADLIPQIYADLFLSWQLTTHLSLLPFSADLRRFVFPQMFADLTPQIYADLFLSWQLTTHLSLLTAFFLADSRRFISR